MEFRKGGIGNEITAVRNHNERQVWFPFFVSTSGFILRPFLIIDLGLTSNQKLELAKDREKEFNF